jgi:hypothetical protein
MYVSGLASERLGPDFSSEIGDELIAGEAARKTGFTGEHRLARILIID